MEDQKIIELCFQRNETALREIQKKYGRYCHNLALNILENQEDAEECVNDTFFRAWNAIPPERPKSLIAYLGAITRNLSFNRKRNNKRIRSHETSDVWEELSPYFPSDESPETNFFQMETRTDINSFLATLSERERNLLLCRYYYVFPIKKIAKQFDLSYDNCKKILSRTVQKLKQYLEEQEI